MAKRRSFSPQFKTEAVLDLLRGQKTQAQICREREIGADQLSRWRDQLLERLPSVFENGSHQSEEQARTEELEHLIGRLTIELDAAKKALRTLGLSVSQKRETIVRMQESDAGEFSTHLLCEVVICLPAASTIDLYPWMIRSYARRSTKSPRSSLATAPDGWSRSSDAVVTW